jgi:hypothetical protein
MASALTSVPPPHRLIPRETRTHRRAPVPPPTSSSVPAVMIFVLGEAGTCLPSVMFEVLALFGRFLGEAVLAGDRG